MSKRTRDRQQKMLPVWAVIIAAAQLSLAVSPATYATDQAHSTKTKQGFFHRHPHLRRIGKEALLGGATGGLAGVALGGGMIGHAVGGAALRGSIKAAKEHKSIKKTAATKHGLPE